MMNGRSCLAALSLVTALAACAVAPDKGAGPVMPAPQPLTKLTGTVTYRERVALPPEARLTVRISDVSLADAAAPVIAEVEMATEGKQVPLAFTLDYDPARITSRGSYAVSARIVDGSGQLIWITDTRTDLPPPGTPIELRVVQVRR